MNAGQDQAGDERRQQKCQDVHLFGFGEGFDQQVDVEVEQLKVIGDLFVAAHRRHQHGHRAPGRRGDRIGRPQIEIRLPP